VKAPYLLIQETKHTLLYAHPRTSLRSVDIIACLQAHLFKKI